jgi:hypothetical protein
MLCSKFSRKMLAYRNLLVEKVLMWVAVAHLRNISITDTGGLLRSYSVLPHNILSESINQSFVSTGGDVL